MSIAINRIQNNSLGLHNICVYIYYVFINTHTCMYMFKKNIWRLYIKYIYIWHQYKYIHVNT